METSLKDKIVAITPDNREMIQMVIKAACQYYGVSEKQLLNEHSLANARHLCFYIIKLTANNLMDYNIGHFFNRKRTAVQYGIDLIEHHHKIYRQTLGNLNSIISIANNFEKNYQWHIPQINTKL